MSTKSGNFDKAIFKMVKQNICKTSPCLYTICAFLKFEPVEQLLCTPCKQDEVILETDGLKIYYTSSKLMELYKSRELSLVEDALFHIILHGLLGHFWSWKQYENQELFDLSADIEVNYWCARLKKEPGSNRRKMKSCHALYKQYQKRIYAQTANVAGIHAKSHVISLDVHERWKNAETEKDCKKLWQQLSGMSTEQFPEELELKIQKGFGSASGDRIQQVNMQDEGQLDFAQVLKKFLNISESYKEDEEQFDKGLYTYGLEEYGDIALIEPSDETETRIHLDSLVIAIDTSGSCSGKLVESFVLEIRKLFIEIQKSYDIFKIVLLQCDEKIQEEVQYSSISDFLHQDDMELKGFGGTNFCPVFERAAALNDTQKIAGLLYFSDGMGDFPSEEPAYKTAFVLWNKTINVFSNIPNWIEKIYVRSDCK